MEAGSCWVSPEVDLKYGYHMWAHMVYQMHTRATWKSFCLCVCCMVLQAVVLVSGLLRAIGSSSWDQGQE